MRRTSNTLMFIGAAIFALGWGVGQLFVEGSTEFSLLLLVGSIAIAVTILVQRRNAAPAPAQPQPANGPQPPASSRPLNWDNPQLRWLLGAGAAGFAGLVLLFASDHTLYGWGYGLGEIGLVTALIGFLLGLAAKKPKKK